ncbi:Hypothetical predicted protein [Podarcis lilfordi]|uniref:Uncharacterized protein n=1 Tax=Podarcis lilfordi TaxID=74358 RepID=A0AA35P3I1_9SAUR|nr:Hypothetical predicted protein [Podarcis lilfordi]
MIAGPLNPRQVAKEFRRRLFRSEKGARRAPPCANHRASLGPAPSAGALGLLRRRLRLFLPQVRSAPSRRGGRKAQLERARGSGWLAEGRRGEGQARRDLWRLPAQRRVSHIAAAAAAAAGEGQQRRPHAQRTKSAARADAQYQPQQPPCLVGATRTCRGEIL